MSDSLFGRKNGPYLLWALGLICAISCVLVLRYYFLSADPDETSALQLHVVSVLLLSACVPIFATLWRRMLELEDPARHPYDPSFLIIATAFTIWVSMFSIKLYLPDATLLVAGLDILNSALFLKTIVFFRFNPLEEGNTIKAMILWLREVLSHRIVGFKIWSTTDLLAFLCFLGALILWWTGAASIIVLTASTVFSLFAMAVLFPAFGLIFFERRYLLMSIVLAVTFICLTYVLYVQVLDILTLIVDDSPKGQQSFDQWEVIASTIYRVFFAMLFIALSFSSFTESISGLVQVIENNQLNGPHDLKNKLPSIPHRINNWIADQEKDQSETLNWEPLRKISDDLETVIELNKMLYHVNLKEEGGQEELNVLRNLRQVLDLFKPLFQQRNEDGQLSTRIQTNIGALTPKESAVLSEQVFTPEENLYIKRIISEWIMNAMKHAYFHKEDLPGDINISISYLPQSENIQISVRDYGKHNKGRLNTHVERLKAFVFMEFKEVPFGENTGWKVIRAIERLKKWELDCRLCAGTSSFSLEDYDPGNQYDGILFALRIPAPVK